MSTRVNRREFIVAGSMLVAGAAVFPAYATSSAATTGDSFLSVAFWGGASRLARRFPAVVPSLVDARSVTTSDPSLLQNGARISLRGFFAMDAAPKPRGVAFSVTYPTQDGSPGPV